jgi:hypothetical protein
VTRERHKKYKSVHGKSTGFGRFSRIRFEAWKFRLETPKTGNVTKISMTKCGLMVNPIGSEIPQ